MDDRQKEFWENYWKQRKKKREKEKSGGFPELPDAEEKKEPSTTAADHTLNDTHSAINEITHILTLTDEEKKIMAEKIEPAFKKNQKVPNIDTIDDEFTTESGNRLNEEYKGLSDDSKTLLLPDQRILYLTIEILRRILGLPLESSKVTDEQLSKALDLALYIVRTLHKNK